MSAYIRLMTILIKRKKGDEEKTVQTRLMKHKCWQVQHVTEKCTVAYMERETLNS